MQAVQPDFFLFFLLESIFQDWMKTVENPRKIKLETKQFTAFYKEIPLIIDNNIVLFN